MNRGGWDTALDAQNELRAYLHTEHGFRDLLSYLDSEVDFAADAYDSENVQHRLSVHRLLAQHSAADRSIEAALHTIEAGDPMWAAPDVAELVGHAATTLRPEPIRPNDLPVPSAFCYFGLPLGPAGARWGVRAVSWEDLGGSVAVAFWSSIRDGLADAQAHGDDVQQFRRLARGRADLMLHADWTIPYGAPVEDDVTGSVGDLLMHYVQALWRLASQRIVVAGPERASRPTWRHPSNWRQIKRVQVMRLRQLRPRTYEGEGTEINWSHRWIVGGHWREQACGKGRKDRALREGAGRQAPSPQAAGHRVHEMTPHDLERLEWTPIPAFRCPHCGDLVCQRPTPGENAGIVCGGPLGHIIIERPTEEAA